VYLGAVYLGGLHTEAAIVELLGKLDEIWDYITCAKRFFRKTQVVIKHGSDYVLVIKYILLHYCSSMRDAADL
jgi:hypothetical protein